MSATAFDTLAATQELEAAGIERKHAEAIAKVVNHGDERAATKADLDTAVTALDARITTLKSDLDTAVTALDARMTALEARMSATLYRALWIQGGAIIAILTALRFLPV